MTDARKDTEPTWGPSQLRREREARRVARAKAKARDRKSDKTKAESSK